MDVWPKRIFVGLLILILSFSLIPNVSASSINTSKVEEIDAFVSEQIQRNEIPGLALALVDGDKVIFMKG